MHEMMINRRKTCTEVDLLLHFGTGDHYDQNKKKRSSGHECEFQCKTCGRWFSSFQALGGHRTSHKRRRNIDINGDDEKMMMIRKLKKAKTKSSHECSVCGVEFEMGQALGGHMRRHKPVLMKKAAVGTSEMKKKQLFFLDLNLFPWENDHLILQDQYRVH